MSAGPLTRDGSRGMLLGLAVGDALGTTLEFQTRDVNPPLTGIVGGGPFNLEPGVWTDDTSMALCLGASLAENGAWDAGDCAQQFVNWWRHGHMSPTGACFDIGITTANALMEVEKGHGPYAGSDHPASAGNGGIMRLAPAVIAFHGSLRLATDVAVMQSQITHAAPECDEYAYALASFLQTGDLGVSLHRLDPATPRDEVHSSGYVRHSYEAAFWAFENTDSFRDCVLLAANLADDSDTVAAIAGQIAGRVYGASAIPADWLDILAWRDMITGMADDLHDLGNTA